MKSTKMFTVLGLGLMVCAVSISNAAPMGTSWNYQGRLMYANSPADGAYDFLFTLFDEPNGGSLLFSVDVNDVNVIDGYFRVGMDFSSDVFDGDARWLEILVRPGDSNDLSDFVALSPRQEITPVPYALQTRGIFVDDTGRVGIGTTNPQSILQVGEASVNYTDDPDSSIGIDDSTPDAKLEITIAPDNTNKDFLMLSSTADEDGDYLIVKNNGYVGIGVTDPPNILSVLSASGGDGISVVDNSGDSKVLLSIAGGDWGFIEVGDGSSGWTRVAPNTSFFSGNVGIGTDSPQGTLEVSHDSSSHDLVVNSSTGNVGIGMTSPSAKLDVNGDMNISSTYKVGAETVLSVLGDENIFVGIGAGANNPGVRNTFLGNYAGYSNTDGSYNTFIGCSSGNSNKEGQNNTFLGLAAGFYNTHGDYNTFLGGHAGFSNTTGNNNTFLGDLAGYSNQTGSGNVFIGYKAGYNVIDSNDKLYIANGPDNSNTLIYGDFSIGRVGIGTTSPNAELEVNGEIRISPDSGSVLKVGRHSVLSPNAYIDTESANQMRLQLNGSTKMVIDTNGNVGIGTTSPGAYRLYVSGPAYSTGGWVGSDRQYKENIKKIESPLDKIKSIKSVSFEWKTSEYKEKGFPEGRHFGVIAQEVEEVLPEIVKEGPDGDKAVSYTELVPILTEAIKEQQKQIENLQYEVKTLKEIMNQHNPAVAK